MDACDPGTESGNIRRLIKLHTGETVKLSRAKVCEIMKAAKENRSPLPPLGLTRDKKYLLDAKSPLTQRDYEILFKSTSKLTDIKRIAKKSGLTQLDKTISDLKGAIGRRLRSMNVREPVLLHGRVTTQRVSSDNKFYNLENNVNTTRNANNNNNNNGERTNINSARVNKNINSARVNKNINSARENSNNNRNRTGNGNRKPNVNVAPRTAQSTGDLARDLARLRHQRRLQSTGGGLGGGRIVANGMGGRRVVANGGGGSSFLRGAMSTNRIIRNTSQSDAAVTQLATERREMARRMNLARQEAERLANRAAESKSASARNEARLARNRYESLRKNMNEKERETKERINKLENEKRNTARKLNNASEKINNISAAKNNATSKLNTATKKKNILEEKYKAAQEQINEEKGKVNQAVEAAKTAQLSNNQTAINEAKRAKETANAKVTELEQQFTTMKQQFNTSQREVTNLKQQATNATTKLNAAQTEVTNMKEKANKKRRNMFETLLNNFNVPMNKRMEYTKRFERGNRIGVIANELKVEAKKKKNANAANRKKLQENLNQSKQNVNTKIIEAAREAGNQARRAAENQAQQNINRIQKNAANEKRTLENSIANAKREANEIRNSTNAKIANAKQEAEAAGREAQKANNTEEMKKANNAKRNANAKVAALEQEAKEKRLRMLTKLLNQYKVTNRQPYINRFNRGERISVLAEEFKKQEATKIQQNKNNALREQREKNAEAVKQKEKQIRLNTLKKLKAQGRLVVHPNKGGNHESFITFQRIVENTEKKAETNGNVSSNDLKTLQNLINKARNKKTSNARTKLTEAQAKANANARAAEQRLANEKASAEKRLTNQKAAANKEMAARRIQNAFRAKQAAAKAEANAKAKSNAEAKAKSNAEAKAKSNAEAKAKSNAEAKAKSNAEARAAANKAAKLATLLNSYKNLTNDEKVGFTRNAQTKNLNSIKRSVIELVRKKAANRKQQANAAAETKAVANRQRAFNNLLKKYPTATNDNKTEARARFNPSSRDQKPANISALKAFLNIRMRTRKEAEEKKKLANKAEADKRSKAKELENLFSKYDTIMGNNSGWPIRKNLVRQQYKKGKSLADIKAELNVMVEFKKKKPVYTNTGSPGPQKKMRINPVATVRNNPLFNVNPEKFGRFKSLVSQKQLAFINPTKRKSIEGQLNQAYKEKSQEKWNKSVKVLIDAQKENRTLRNAAAKNKVNSALKVRKNAMLQNIKKLNKPAQNSFVGRIPKADSAGLNMIRKEINQALRNKQEQNKRKLLPKAKSSNNLKKPFNKMSNKAGKPNISQKFRSYQLALAARAQKLIKQQDREFGKVRSYVGSKWKGIIERETRTDLGLQRIDVSLRAREDMVKQINDLPDKIKESKKQKIKELRSYIVPYGQDVSLFKDKLAEITGNISKMR
jgi:hypothetical protein